jgi:hypothetical protein
VRLRNRWEPKLDIAIDELAATVLINGVSPDRATFGSSLRATNVLESLKFEELGTKLIDEGARTLGSRATWTRQQGPFCLRPTAG